MVKFDVQAIRFLDSQHFRVLTAVEMGMKNHELVPLPLISSIATIHRGATARTLNDLTRNRLVAYERGKKFDGYRLTTLGYDFLALRALCSRGTVGSVGNQIGVGKESDIYVAGDPDSKDIVLKLHRLGRTSFRKLKEKRDYHRRRHYCSWLYLSRLAAVKEFAFLSALHEHGFPVPKPIDISRHIVVMELITDPTLCHINQLNDPGALYEKLMKLIVRLGSYGLIHGDFNEFNIMLKENENPIMIDFPQMVSIDHPNAEFYFNRDVNCVRTFFQRRFGFEANEWPRFGDVKRHYNIDVELEASGFTKKMRHDLNKAYDEGNFTAHLEDVIKSENECSEDDKEPEQDEPSMAMLADEMNLRLHMTYDDHLEDANCEVENNLNENVESVCDDDNDDEENHEQGSIFSNCTRNTTIIPAEEVKRRLLTERSKVKEKLRVKGRQSAVRRGRQQNQELIREYAGWDQY